MKQGQGILYTMLSAVAFGFMPIFASIAYKEGFNCVTVVFLRFLITSIILLGYILVRRINLRVNEKQFLKVIYIGMGGYAATCLMLFLSYRYISVGLATVIHFVYPAVVTFLAFIMYKEKLDLNKIVSLFLCIVGVYILVGFSEVHLNYKGIMLAFISGITYAIYIVEAGHSEIKNMDSLVLAFYLCVFSSLGILIIGGATRSLRFTATYRGWGAVFGIVIVCTVAACIAFNKGIKIIGSSRAAILSTLEPITSMILGVIIFGDVLCMNYLIGSIFIIISVVVLITPSNRKRIRKPTY